MGATLSRALKLADSQFGGGATTWAPGIWYAGLSTTVPASDGTGFTEPVGSAYGRVAVTNGVTQWPAASIVDGVARKTNGAKITWTNPTGPWGAILYYGFFTAASGGVPEWTGKMDGVISPKSGLSPVEFDIGQLALLFR